MPKSSNQKLKLWFLYRILFENTDEDTPMTMLQIIAELERYGISAERKSVYNDIELLVNAGVDIVSEKRDKYVYYMGSRDFQLAELKLLVDCVQASKFITAKKAMNLYANLRVWQVKIRHRNCNVRFIYQTELKTLMKRFIIILTCYTMR